MSQFFVSTSAIIPDNPNIPTNFVGDFGNAVPAANTITIFANNASNKSGATVFFNNSGSTSTLNLSDSLINTFLGNQSGNLTYTGNSNTGVGVNSMNFLTSGSANVGFGYESLYNLTSGGANTGLGELALSFLLTGSNNIGVGRGAGSNYGGTESYNICIGNTGTGGESQTLRLGRQAAGVTGQSTCFIAGIINNTVSLPALMTINTSTSQIGTLPMTGQKVLLSSQQASSSSTITFTNVAGYAYYILEFFEVIIGTSTANLQLQLSTNNGSSYVGSGYTQEGYQSVGGVLGNWNTASNFFYITNSSSNSTSLMANGYINFYGFGNNSVDKNMIITANYTNSSPSFIDFHTSGQLATTTVVNAIQLATSSGTITSGTFNLYGVSA